MSEMKAESIHFPFDERKAADAAGYLLTLGGGQMNYMRLLKLLYVAERVSLDRFSRPIIGDRYVSMKMGPVLGKVYDFIKYGDIPGQPGGPWSRLIERHETYAVRLKDKPDLGSLSTAELAILEEVFGLYRKLNQYHLSDVTHAEFEEWEDPGESSRDIPIERLLEVLGKKPNEVEKIRQYAREQVHFRKIFGS